MKNKFIFILIFILLLTSCKSKMKNESKELSNSSYSSSSIIESSNSKIDELESLGTWWWNNKLNENEYVQFAKDNNVTEIYYCDYNMERSDTLLGLAHDNNIKVYLLLGEKEWLNDRTNLDNIINNYINYINYQSNHEFKFCGIHLDVEPLEPLMMKITRF